MSFKRPLKSQLVKGALREYLVTSMVSFGEILNREFDHKTGRFYPMDDFKWDIRHQYPIITLAHLYLLRDPINPYKDSKHLLNMCIKGGDALVNVQDNAGRFPEEDVFGPVEWPAYYLARSAQVLKGNLPPRVKVNWLRAIEKYCHHIHGKSILSGAPNHNAWRAIALYVAGKVLKSQKWMKAGLQVGHQLASYQYAPGYWEEGRHHGPSMFFLSGVARPMTMLAMESRDPTIIKMTERARDFMIQFSLPDGGTLGSFDSRLPYCISQLNVNFSTSAYGRRLNLLSLESIKRRTASIPKNYPCVDSNLHNAHSTAATRADCLDFWADGSSKILPQEKDGYQTRFDFGLHSGSMIRENDWVVGMSAIISDVPILSSNPYIVDRQSRLDIWHKDIGLIVGGGGHNLVHRSTGNQLSWVPPANAHIVTGWDNTGKSSCDFGLVKSTHYKWGRLQYFPLAANIKRIGKVNELQLNYTHAVIDMVIKPVNVNNIKIEFDITSNGANKILLQLPIIIYRGAKLMLNKKLLNLSKNNFLSEPLKTVFIQGPNDDPTVHFKWNHSWETRIRYPLVSRPIKTNHKKYSRTPSYTIALLSTEVVNPMPSFKASYYLNISS